MTKYLFVGLLFSKQSTFLWHRLLNMQRLTGSMREMLEIGDFGSKWMNCDGKQHPNTNPNHVYWEDQSACRGFRSELSIYSAREWNMIVWYLEWFELSDPFGFGSLVDENAYSGSGLGRRLDDGSIPLCCPTWNFAEYTPLWSAMLLENPILNTR